MNERRKVILITDGDRCAKKAIEVAAKNIGGRCISRSGGNPTPITAEEIIDLIKEANNDPVIVMVDDEGNENIGIGEKILCKLVNHPTIEVLGVVVVASNTKDVDGVHPDFCIDGDGNIIDEAVDKDGNPTVEKVLYGDTVDIVEKCKVPIIIGIGDVGKMQGKDDSKKGAPIITKALQEILNRSEMLDEKQ
ncbi:stage V sporulation protein AE [Clostridium aceticum]|uniref:Stage V sporulation protein AE n=1 Tax=Clostridium aceticum TaxID=84022 RepID=A0A0D8IC54_9CLOT|nr:stage V sporulation protein AE [Clostridium aceticum]AKL94967.1 stage V sporulation protein AE [Clostridium aceticum]KJF27880.1 stage V sporulation protein AE [Clostridium aceticum]